MSIIGVLQIVLLIATAIYAAIVGFSALMTGVWSNTGGPLLDISSIYALIILITVTCVLLKSFVFVESEILITTATFLTAIALIIIELYVKYERVIPSSYTIFNKIAPIPILILIISFIWDISKYIHFKK